MLTATRPSPGFARITARNEDEMRRMSFCGTDGYVSTLSTTPLANAV
jgi:hypothetical protein